MFISIYINLVSVLLQVVWKSSTKLGCGKAVVDRLDGSTETYMVARYSPPGNMAGTFTTYVARPVANGMFTINYHT